jgi:hypothetical protein
MIFIKVVLPPPDDPAIVRNRPASIVRFTFLRMNGSVSA